MSQLAIYDAGPAREKDEAGSRADALGEFDDGDNEKARRAGAVDGLRFGLYLGRRSARLTDDLLPDEGILLASKDGNANLPVND